MYSDYYSDFRTMLNIIIGILHVNGWDNYAKEMSESQHCL